MQFLPLVPFFTFIALANAVLLPSIYVKDSSSVSVPHSVGGHWWAQVGDRVFYAPPASLLALSQNVSDYYYTMGSKSAVTPKMAEHVVGSRGRWHILHLPKGPSMLQLSGMSSSGDRRESFSALTQLKSGTVLSTGFPFYKLDTKYKNPLSIENQKLEKEAVSKVTDDTAMDYLKKLVGNSETRAYNNADQSGKAEKFLKNELEALGIHTCYHTFDSGSTSLTNVVAHIPGPEPGAVIVGAHYDSRPFEGAAPGAEDNGSGVAALLAMAKSFKAVKAVPKKSVFFVAFAGEEPGLIGSKYFAEALKNDKLPSECTAASSFIQKSQRNVLRNRPAAFKASDYSAIVMDEIGWASPKMNKLTVNLESFDAQGKEIMDHLRGSAETHIGDKIDVVHNAHPFGSDHMSFLENGVASVLTINGDDEAYPNYHKATDKISKENISPPLMAMITKINLGAMMRIAM